MALVVGKFPRFVEMLNLNLAKHPKAVEAPQNQLNPEELEQASVPGFHAGELSLKFNSEGNAKTMIKTSQARGEHPLETSRILSWECDPKELGTELSELNDLVSTNKLNARISLEPA